LKKLKLLIVLLAASLSACTLTEHIHFNDDFSGNVRYTIDYSWYTSLIDMADSTEEMNVGIDSVIQESMMAGNFDTFEGISNFGYANDSASKLLIITYDFANLQALNTFSGNSQNIENTLTGASTREFSVKGNKLLLKSPLINSDSIDEELAEFGEYYKYSLILSFDRTIKKVNNKNAVISDDKRKITLEGELFKLFSDEFESDMIINLK